MRMQGITTAEFEQAINAANVNYGGNLLMHPNAHDIAKRSCQGRVIVKDSYGEGSRTSWSGRHGRIVCWHAYRDVIREIFKINPHAKIVTSLSVYDGAEDFENVYPATGNRNIGSEWEPAYMPELCNGKRCEDDE